MRRQAMRDAKSDLRSFWAVHRAAAAIMSEDGADAANEYITNHNEFIYGPAPVDKESADAVMKAIGAQFK